MSWPIHPDEDARMEALQHVELLDLPKDEVSTLPDEGWHITPLPPPFLGIRADHESVRERAVGADLSGVARGRAAAVVPE